MDAREEAERGVVRVAEIDEVLRCGLRAASGGNMQPWRISRRSENRVELSVDLGRSTTLIDAGRWASVFALGSFVENVLVAAEHLGLVVEIARSDTSSPEAVRIEVIFVGRRERAGAHPLFDAISTRETNRGPHAGADISDSDVSDLSRVVRDAFTNHRLFVARDSTSLETLSSVLAASDRIRMKHRRFHDEMMHEVRWSVPEVEGTSDGIDFRSLGLSTPELLGIRALRRFWVARHLMPAKVIEEGSRRLLKKTPLIGVVAAAAAGGGPLSVEDFLDLGQTVQRVWLNIEARGQALQPWTTLPFMVMRVRHLRGEGLRPGEAKEILALDERLRASLGMSPEFTPVFIFRWFRAARQRVKSTRRSLDALLEE